jgi:hypothetical protein
LFFVVLSLQGATSFAAEAVLSGDYLDGKWSDSGKEGCTSDLAGYVIFHNNRTVQAGKGKSVSAAGFWELGNDTVFIHLLVSPRSGGAGHPFYQKRYYYQHLAAKMLKIQSDSFDYTTDPAAQAGEKTTLTRCQ